MAFKHANSVSSIWTSVMGLTSSSMIRAPTRVMLRSAVASRTGETKKKSTFKNSFTDFSVLDVLGTIIFRHCIDVLIQKKSEKYYLSYDIV